MSDDLFQDEPSESLHYEKWNVDVVRKFLEEQKIDDDSVDKLCTCTTFQEKKFEGKDLPRLTRQDLNNMKIIDFDEQDRLLKLFSGLRQVKIRSLSKVFNDSIHGHIELHPLLVKIIDTPQFQRLRDIKQLGGCYFVYPGASHNRFEHSIGVCHLAGELVETLRAHQPELNITDKDVLCVKMAGLCHDLGHGPFSHMFDKVYMPLYAVEKDLGSWKHEKGSIDMLDHLIEENELKLEEYDITREDIIFVKEQIVGYPIDDKNRKKPSGDGWLYEGRKEEKNFLYEIVASQKNGIDVDKWDYIARDCHHLGITMGFDYCRFMKYARVISVDERLHICTRDKEVDELYKMFHTRLMLHKTAYQHKTVCVIERMISEAFSMVENKLKFGKEGKKVSLPNCIDDMCAYTSLTDHVFHQILLSDDKDLEQAQKLLKNILTRDLYKFIGQTTPFSLSDECSDKSSDKSSDKGSDKKSDKWLKKENGKDIASEIFKLLDTLVDEPNEQKLTCNDLLVDVVTFDYGLREENPIDYMRFYAKNDPFKACPLTDSQFTRLIPKEFKEQKIRLYCKNRDIEVCRLAYKCFEKWCSTDNNLTVGSVVRSLKMGDSPFKPSGPSRTVNPANASVRRNLKTSFANS